MCRYTSQATQKRYDVKGLVTSNTHVQYESSISYGKRVMAKVKVFVHPFNAEADAEANADTRAMTLAPRTFVSAL